MNLRAAAEDVSLETSAVFWRGRGGEELLVAFGLPMV